MHFMDFHATMDVRFPNLKALDDLSESLPAKGPKLAYEL